LLRGVCKVYPSATPVTALDDVTLGIGIGEFLTIYGPSGSGKSTLLNIIGLLDSPTSGTVEIGGIDAATATDRERDVVRRQHIGFVFQAFHLVPRLQVIDNVALPLLYHGISGQRARTAASTAIGLVGLEHRKDHRPRELSGGESQRCAIARALVTDPVVLLCDEPTGNLDSQSTTQLLDLLSDLNGGGQTVVVVSHDPLVAERSTRVVEIVDGQVR